MSKKAVPVAGFGAGAGKTLKKSAEGAEPAFNRAFPGCEARRAG
jgi:hypothetical protein